jgi:DNA polymerase III alpha subunit
MITDQYRQKIDNLPAVPFPPEIRNATEYFVSLVEAGVRYRYGKTAPEVRQRVQKEMDAILSAHFEKYFLVWWKIAAICRENEVLYFCTSEANSSIICYVLEITDIDPLEHNLLFEYFFNSKMEYAHGWWGEKALISFCVSQNIIQYLRDNFGSECVAMHINECNLAEIIITKKPVDEKEDSFCYIFSMPGENENDSDWSKFSLISSSSFHAISYSDPKTIDQVKEDRDEIYSKCHLKKLLGKLDINSFSDLLIMEAISYFDDDVANEIVSDLIKRKAMGYKPLFKGAEKILDETYGRILFEEQFILLVQMVTGWDMEKTYRFFLDISYEKTCDVRLEFIECAKKSGVSLKDSEELYNALLEASHKLMGKAFIFPWVQEIWRKSYLRAHYPDAFISKEIER